MELENKKVVLIGGSHGMGLGTAKIASAAGAEVILIGRDETQLQSAKNMLGPRTHIITGDLTQPDGYPTWMEAIGTFDHLFISASPGGESSFNATYPDIESSYAATEALVKAMAVSLTPVRVNAVRPTWVDKEGDHTATAKNLHGFMGSNHDIGHAVVFLMTNDYMTGQVLEVDGGASLV